MKVVWISGSYESVKLNLGKETYYRMLLQLVLNVITGDLSQEIDIYTMYICITMNKVKVEETTEITIKGIYGFIGRKVTKFGSGAKVDCPKEVLDRKVYLIITRDKE